MTEQSANMTIHIDIKSQTLQLKDNDTIIKEYLVSTAKNGAGEKMDSECTPRGRHRVAELIGKSSKPNTVFAGRKATGEYYSPALRNRSPDRDWVLTRIIRLAGCEEAVNKGDGVDSFARYIYIHGAPDDVKMGKPGSHGCIRMRNEEIIELFDTIEMDTPVLITE